MGPARQARKPGATTAQRAEERPTLRRRPACSNETAVTRALLLFDALKRTSRCTEQWVYRLVIAQLVDPLAERTRRSRSLSDHLHDNLATPGAGVELDDHDLLPGAEGQRAVEERDRQRRWTRSRTPSSRLISNRIPSFGLITVDQEIVFHGEYVDRRSVCSFTVFSGSRIIRPLDSLAPNARPGNLIPSHETLT
jgi:hypothetical protein